LTRVLEAAGHTVVMQVSRPGWSERRFLDDGSVWEQLAYAQPDKVIIALGGNNMESASSYSATFHAFVEQLRERGVKDIAWMGPYPADAARAGSTAARHDSTRTALLALAPLHQVTLWDVYPHGDLSGSRDGVHLTSTAYRAVVDALTSDVLSWANATSLVSPSVRMYVYAGIGALGLVGLALLLRRWRR
jgi:lysophospholipase L1-like esterase